MQKENNSKSRIAEIEGIDIVHALYVLLTTDILNVEANSAKIISSYASMPFIDELSDDDFFRHLFKLMAYSETGSTAKFISSLKKFYDQGINQEKKLILARVTRVFIVTNYLSTEDKDKLSAITGIKVSTMVLLSSAPDAIK